MIIKLVYYGISAYWNDVASRKLSGWLNIVKMLERGRLKP